MTPREKLEEINNKIETLNKEVFIHKSWELAFENKGANNYCILIRTKKKEYFCGKFDTYGSVISCLDLMLCMFSWELKKIEREKND